MSEQIEKIDITFRDLEAHDVRILANATKLHIFIDDMKDYIQEKIKRDDNEDVISVFESMRHYFFDCLDNYKIRDLFD